MLNRAHLNLMTTNILSLSVRQSMRTVSLLCLQFPNVLHKCLLMHKTSVLAISGNTYVPQPKFYETLIYKVHRRMRIESDRCLYRILVNPNDGFE